MRYLAPAILLVAPVSAQTVNTQVNGLTLTNRVFSLSDDSAVATGANKTTGVGYLTDNDTSSFVFNVGTYNGGSQPIVNGALEGYFNGPIGGTSTGLYIISLASNGQVLSGSFDVQLRLLTSQTNTVSLNASSFTITTQSLVSGPGYQNLSASLVNISDYTASSAFLYAYAYVPYATFGLADGSDLVGVKLSNFTLTWPEISYIGLGYSSGGAVPEPSTYGLMLGGLALGCAALRRRRKA